VVRGGYVQHGDLNGENILVCNSDFVMIDFDCMDIYPPFYDFFTFLGFNEWMIPLFLDGIFDEELRLLATSICDEFDEKTKDKYLAVFLAVIKFNWMKRVYLRYIPESYTISLMVLDKLQISNASEINLSQRSTYGSAI